MALEVYTRTKPAHARRTLLCTLIMITGTGLLGHQMTRSRAGELLAERVELDAMNCSIRPPRRSTRTDLLVERPWKVQTFHVMVTPTLPASFALWHTPLQESDAGDRLASEIFAQLNPTTVFGGQIPFGRSEDVAIGTFTGLELWNNETGVVVRVVEIPGGGYLGASMISNAPIESWRMMFDRSCRSVEFEQ